MKKRYKMTKLKGSNIFLKACNLSERVYSFNTANFFMLYGVVMEKVGVKPPFTVFQWSVL